MEAKFKVGDRVIVTNQKAKCFNKIGTIKFIDQDETPYLVEFDEFVYGHSGDDRGKYGHCHWYYKEDIKLVKDKKADRIIFRDNATILFKDGKKYVAKCEKGDTYDREKGLLVCLAKANGITFKDLQEMLENAEFQSDKQNRHIEEGKYKVGDFVKVVNSGCMFTTYAGWFDIHAPKFKHKYIETQRLDIDPEEPIYKVVAKGKHSRWTHYGMLYALKDNKGNIILIEEKGIANYSLADIFSNN